MTKVKICAVRTLEAAQTAVNAGADFLGFVFAQNTSRYINPKEAKKIILKLQGTVQIVGVFKRTSINRINTLIDELNLDFVQLHNFGNPDFCKQIKAGVIRSFGLESDFSTKEVLDTFKAYSVSYYHLDRKVRGEGAVLNLDKSKEIARKFSIFFSGGLTPENIKEVVAAIRPFAVDVSSGVETNGVQDLGKIKMFITNAKEGAL